MRIASYNIMSGGFNSYSYNSKIPERLTILKEALLDIKADFIGLVDTFKWDEVFTNDQIAKIFGYKSAYCINLNDSRLIKKGHNNGITVLTNMEVESFEAVNIETRNALKTRLIIKGKKLDIYTTYLDDLSEDIRVKQIKVLLKTIKRTIPTIIMGDLNTLKKDDVKLFTTLIDKFFLNNPKLLAEYGGIIKDMKRGEVVDLIQNQGLIDADLKSNPTAPSKLFPVKIEEPMLRLDYLFHTENIIAANFEVKREDIYDKASDHYPVVFDCDLR